MDSNNELDPIVERAVVLLEGAAAALRRNNKYNNGFTYQDYMVHGFQTCVDRLLEPIMRLRASGSYDQAVDCPAYAALAASFILEGEPQSRIRAEEKVELQSMSEHENNTNGDGSTAVPTLPNG